MSKVMSLPDQRAWAAKLMGWERVEYDPNVDAKLGPPFLPCYRPPGGLVRCDVVQYRPDTKLQQADELKARLREGGSFYYAEWVGSRLGYRFAISYVSGKPTRCYNGESKLSEGAALLDAGANIPIGE